MQEGRWVAPVWDAGAERRAKRAPNDARGTNSLPYMIAEGGSLGWFAQPLLAPTYFFLRGLFARAPVRRRYRGFHRGPGTWGPGSRGPNRGARPRGSWEAVGPGILGGRAKFDPWILNIAISICLVWKQSHQSFTFDGGYSSRPHALPFANGSAYSWQLWSAGQAN